MEKYYGTKFGRTSYYHSAYISLELRKETKEALKTGNISLCDVMATMLKVEHVDIQQHEDYENLYHIWNVTEGSNQYYFYDDNLHDALTKKIVLKLYRGKRMSKGFWVKGNVYKTPDKTDYYKEPVIHRFDTIEEARFFKSQVANGAIIRWGENENGDYDDDKESQKVNLRIK